jgi:hypothetical protein
VKDCSPRIQTCNRSKESVRVAFWVVLFAALAQGWWLDRHRLQQEHQRYVEAAEKRHYLIFP